MNILMNVWSYFATNILEQPAFMIGLIVMIGYILLKKPWYDVLVGVIKAIVGYLILTVGSSGLVSNFRPVLVGLKDVFKIDAMVIDPYFGQNAVTAGVEEVFGKGFGDAMILLLIAFIVNILLVRFSKFTKLRALFTTGHVQVQQAATAYWQAEKLFGKKKDGKEVKKIDDVELPGFMSIFNENMVCTSLCIIRRKNGSCSV